MKLLFLSQGKQISDHPGWHDALIKLKGEGVISDFENIPYFGYAEKFGWDNFYKMVVEKCEEEKFDIVYFHYFHRKGKPSPSLCMKKLLSMSNRPIVITSCGDGFSENWMRPDYPDDFKDASRLADITFSTQMGKAADKMMKWGAKNVVFTPNSMRQVRFFAQSISPDKHKFDFDVVFVGSKNSNRINPISKFYWATREREKLVRTLSQRFGKRFGLFGKGWNYESAQGPIPFNKQQETFKRGRIVVGGNPYSYSDYYSSNRVFFEISSGIPTVELVVPRLNKIVRDNDHIYFANSIPEIIKKVEYLLSLDPYNLYIKSSNAAKYIENNHTQYHRMKFKIDTAKRYKANNYRLDVKFPFFLPEVDLEQEKNFAIRENK
jgi:hypothetical protein